ncbi:hypothetical protein HA402_000172 [Bradysia odoriphaga]|nr:hypothetical protein HA402_000172 [Bradysia odoriphaga]
MGVSGFQKLQAAEEVGGNEKVHIIEKICDWKIDHPEQQPIVVCRLKEVLMSVVQLNIKAAFFGGSHRFYHQQLDKFFQPLLDMNVKLVFFGGGQKTKEKLEKLLPKMDHNYMKYNSLMAFYDKHKIMKTCARPELRTCLGLYEEGIARKYGEFILVTGSLNKTIVEYCRGNENVVAVLAKDSDFTIYDLKHVEYWGCGIEELNFKNMTTFSFSRAALLAHLKLTPHQFHVLVAIVATILDDVQTNWLWLKKGVLPVKSLGSINIIRGVTACVRKNVPAVEEKPRFGDWTKMIFHSHHERYCWMIEKQFKKYELSEDKPAAEDDKNTTNILKKYKGIWSIVNDDVLRIDYIFQDLDRWNDDRNAMSLQNLFVMVLKRAMGIVLHSKRDDETLKRRFLMRGHHNERFKVLPKTLIFSSLDVPPIEKLIDEQTDADEEFITMKWTLLFWILHLDFDDDVKLKIRTLPREIAPVVLTVLFLLWERQITPLEGDSIIISENGILKEPTDTDCVMYELPSKVDGRTLRVSHVYVFTRTIINRCLQICGIDLFNVPVSFDGIHFHNLINEFVADTAAFENKKADIKGFQVGEF